MAPQNLAAQGTFAFHTRAFARRPFPSSFASSFPQAHTSVVIVLLLAVHRVWQKRFVEPAAAAAAAAAAAVWRAGKQDKRGGGGNGAGGRSSGRAGRQTWLSAAPNVLW